MSGTFKLHNDWVVAVRGDRFANIKMASWFQTGMCSAVRAASRTITSLGDPKFSGLVAVYIGSTVSLNRTESN